MLLVALSGAPLIILTLHTAWEDRRRDRAAWQQRVERFSELASAEDKALVANTKQLLVAVAASSEVLSGQKLFSEKLLRDCGALGPFYTNLMVMDTNGNVLISANRRQNWTPQSWLVNRALRTKGLALSGLGPRGGHRINVAYPVFDAPDLKAGVQVSIDLSSLERFTSQSRQDFPPKATWAELHTNGVILAHYSKQEHPDQLPVQWLLTTIGEREKGMLQYASPKGPVIYAFTTRNSPLVGKTLAVLGIPMHDLFAAADRALAVNLVWFAAAAGLALAFGWIGSNFLVVRPVKALVRSSARLAAGDLSARSGLRPGHDELGQLTLAFDQMAHALENREQERKRASQKLQALSHRLVEVQESERRHIARELHDEIGQALTAAEMNLQAALQSPRAPTLERRLGAAIEAVEQVLEQVHDLSLNLRPSMLDDLGLEPALRWYLRRQSELAGWRTEFHADPLDDRVHPIIETECFRVAQEALNNVVRHAKATAVRVDLSKQDDHLHLSVLDDGIGFDVPVLRRRAVAGASLGLLSMEERATLTGGGFELKSQPGQGTEVHAWFPLTLPKIEPMVEIS